MFHHFCSQWCKHFPKNGKLQFSSGVFIFFIFVLSFFIIFASSGAQILQKMENCNFPRVFFHFFNHFFIFFMFHHFCFQWCKNFPKNGKLQCSPSFFSFFYIFFKIMFHHFCFQWCKNFPKNEKLQFSSVFFHFLIIFLNHFSSFLLPVVQKFSKKWKIAIFLECFHFFFFLKSFFIIFASSFLLPVVQKFSKK